MDRLRVALPGALLAILLAAPAVLAYDSEVGNQVNVGGGGQFVCPTSRTLTATVVDLQGNPLAGVTVTWSTGAVTTTNAQGHTSITLNVTASGTITASTKEAVGSVTLTCITGEGNVGGTIGLPRTDTALPATTTRLGATWALLLVVAFGLGLVRVARRR
jgi:hypothetical protein